MTKGPISQLMSLVLLFFVVMTPALVAEEAGEVEMFVSAPVEALVVDIDLRQLPKIKPQAGIVRTVPRKRPDFPTPPPLRGPVVDPVRQGPVAHTRTPAPLLSFEGVSTGSAPPDTTGDVGPNHFVQAVNTSFAIYDKTGTLLAGPSSISAIFAAAGAGAPCGTTNHGDPIVLYDPLADRWLISQFVDQSPPHQCVAISQSGDPVSGGFYAYDFTLTQFPDYPKFGVWPDAYYMGANSGVQAYALDRSNMLTGAAATFVSFSPGAVGAHSMLIPSDLDGSTPPPPDAPNYFFRFIDGESFGGSDRLEIFEFHVDFATPANSTFTGPTTLSPAAFASLCSFSFNCIRQPDTSQRVDSITEWPMFRLAYRNFGSHESMVVNHAVNVGGDQAGVRWYELRDHGSGWTLHQQGTWAPDGDSRWMASAAMDKMGNLAIGYNVSSISTYPSLRYAGRLVDDPLGELSQGENTLIAGGGSQTGHNRWGDYSQLSVDPTDDCTFFFTGEYYPETASSGWRTRIGSFKFDNCSGTVIFTDGFETNGTARWSNTVPPL